MIDRKRHWARFVRMLLPEMRGEEQLLQWIHDEEIERVIAYLESWKNTERTELRQYKDQLGRLNRYFDSHGYLNAAGFSEAINEEQRGQTGLNEIEDELRYRSERIREVQMLIRWARESVEGTITIEEADQMYAEVTGKEKPRGSHPEH